MTQWVKRNRHDSPDRRRTNLYVKGLPADFGEEWLRALFGPISSVNPLRRQEGQAAAQAAFAKHETAESAKKAMDELHGKDVRIDEQRAPQSEGEPPENDTLCVGRARRKAERQRELRERSGEYEDHAWSIGAFSAAATIASEVAPAAAEAPAVTDRVRSAEPALSAQAVASGELQGPCSHGFAKTAKMLASKCMKVCPSLCGPWGAATKAFLGKGRQEGAMKEICAQTQDFTCAFNHKDVCEALGRKARKLGFHMPTLKSDLYAKCR